MQYLNNARIQLVEAVAILDKALSTGKLPSIERDILLAKLATTYEAILLEKGNPASRSEKNSHISMAEIDEKPKTKYGQKESETIEPASTSTISQHQEVEPAKQEPAIIKDGNTLPAKPTIKPDPAPQYSEESTAILADKYQGKRKFRNEVIAEQHQKTDMQSKLQSKPITDLAKAIGINDKFLFIKELFGGDADLYAQTIKHLNQLTDLNDAIIFIQENFDWDADNETAMAFIDLIRRKFA